MSQAGRYSVEEVHTEVQLLKEKVANLEKEIKAFQDGGSGEAVIVLRTITREQAKQEIMELFQTGETLYYSDIAQRLRIDLPLVVEICQELENEGEIGVDADVLQQRGCSAWRSCSH